MENENIVEMKSISKSFGGLQALSGVNLELRRGEILGLVGDNAAGKSTLMKILTGAYQADEGRIFFEGKSVHISNPYISKQLGIEMAYQNFALCPNLDVAGNLFLGREIAVGRVFSFLRKRTMRREALEVLKRLKIDIRNPRTRIDRLSGGQQQAVAIGKATSFNPKVVIMDEPTANLAVKEIGKVLELTLVLRNRGISIIFITHRLEDVFMVSDRILILKGGHKVAIKEKTKTNKDEIVRLMFIGTDSEQD
jgi:ABC-type sugar transport system ATPase subunit